MAFFRKKSKFDSLPDKYQDVADRVRAAEQAKDWKKTVLVRETNRLRGVLDSKVKSVKEQYFIALDELYSLDSQGSDRAKIEALRDRVKSLEKSYLHTREKVLEDILPEAFALVQETIRRFHDKKITYDVQGVSQTWSIPRAYDEQIVAGAVLSNHEIAEQATGEGKTLTAIFAAYLNALDGEGVHIVTPNDYLAERDSQMMGPILKALGISVGNVKDDISNEEKAEQYNKDVIYASNEQFAFDFLRSQLVSDISDRVYKPATMAIVDEADNILIDKALTPHIISSEATNSGRLYNLLNDILTDEKGELLLVQAQKKKFKSYSEEKEASFDEKYENGDFFIEGKNESVSLTEDGLKKVESIIEAAIGREAFEKAKEDYKKQLEAEEGTELTGDFYFPFMQEVLNVINAHTVYKINEKYLVEYKAVLVDPETSQVIMELGQDAVFNEIRNRRFNPKNPHSMVKYSLKETDDSYEIQIFDKDKKSESDDEPQLLEGVLRNECQVRIIDQYIGQVQKGTRWRRGLHQAIEAKEQLFARAESSSTEQISLQNYFLTQYSKLSGMTGTAITDEQELKNIYGLEVVQIPTHKPSARADSGYNIFINTEAAIEKALDDIVNIHLSGRPILVVTTSDDASNYFYQKMIEKAVPKIVDKIVARQDLSKLKLPEEIVKLGITREQVVRAGLTNSVQKNMQLLNARETYDDQLKQANIIAQAGMPGSIVVSTQICGRGVDIKLGGANSEEKMHDAVNSRGGLCIIGIGMQQDERIERQINGRAGRQGDNGSSVYYIGLDDQLVRRFIPEGSTIAKMQELSFTFQDKSKPLENTNFLTDAFHELQHNIRNHHFEGRKNVWEYDNITNMFLNGIRGLRDSVLEDKVNKTGSTLSYLVNDYVRSLGQQLSEKNGSITFYELQNHARLLGCDDLLKQFDDPTKVDAVARKHIKDALLNAVSVFEQNPSRLYAGMQKIWAEVPEHVQKQMLGGVLSELSQLTTSYVGILDDLKMQRYGANSPEMEKVAFLKNNESIIRAELGKIAYKALDLLVESHSMYKSEPAEDKKVSQA